MEIDSQKPHLLAAGSWDVTQARRTALSGAGYFILPISPAQVAADPAGVLAAVWAHYELLCAA